MVKKILNNLALVFFSPYIIYSNIRYSLSLRAYLVKDAYYLSNLHLVTSQELKEHVLPDFGVIDPLNDTPSWYNYIYSTMPNKRTKWFCGKVNIDYDTMYD